MNENSMEGWVTLTNGTHVFLDVNGNIVKGPNALVNENITKIGHGVASKPTPVPKIPTKHFDGYLHECDGDYVMAVKRYYKNEMQNHYVDANINGETEQVFFGRAVGDNKKNDLLKYMENRPPLPNMVPHIPDVISTGIYDGFETPSHERSDYVGFHVFHKNIEYADTEYKVTVKVGERTDGTKMFNFYYFKKNIAKDCSLAIIPRLTLAVGQEISRPVQRLPQDLLCLGFYVEEVKHEFTGPFAGLNRLRAARDGR